MGDGRDESQLEAVRNQISDGAVVFGQRLDWRKLLGIAGGVGLRLSGAA
ncbi:hypothetical protein [Amycolatopsis sp. NPDC049868]